MDETNRQIRYHELFDTDVIEAANWYDDRSSGLGDAFAGKVEEAVLDITQDPTRFSEIVQGMRYIRVHRFPYVALFDVTDREILYLGVLHTARSIEKW